MTTLSQYLLAKKIAALNLSQESVETLSLWMLHHRKHATAIVKYWAERFVTVSPTRKLAFIFLANEIVKATESKSLQFRKEFEKVLPDIFRHVGQSSTCSQLLEQIHRILDIWRHRCFFNGKTIDKFWACLNGEKPEKIDEAGVQEEPPQQIRKLLLSLHAPDAETLIETLNSLEDAPSVDERARAEIAKLPKNLFEIDSLDALRNASEANEFGKNLERAMELVEDYNERLEVEVVKREKLNIMLEAFKEAELERISEIGRKMEELERKLDTMGELREEMKRHRAALPDLACCPNVQELPPLPSVEDLFKK